MTMTQLPFPMLLKQWKTTQSDSRICHITHTRSKPTACSACFICTMMIYTLNILSQWLVIIAAVTATTLTGYAVNRLRSGKATLRRNSTP